jgi:hypothetical protein
MDILEGLKDMINNIKDKTISSKIMNRHKGNWTIDHKEVELFVNNFIKDKNNNSKKYDYVITDFKFSRNNSYCEYYFITIEIKDKEINLSDIQEAYLEKEGNENTPIAKIIKEDSYFPLIVCKPEQPKKDTSENRCSMC